jgi:predicted permease
MVEPGMAVRQLTQFVTQRSFWQDFQQALRLPRRQPLFALGAVVVLALGIGLVTSLFSLMNAVLFRPWQVPDPESMAVIRARQAGQEVSGAISIAEYRYLLQYSRTFSHLAAWNLGPSRIDDGAGNQFRVTSAFVNADYFTALGVEIGAGRGFVADDEDYSRPKAVAIISHHLWRSRFGSDPALIGRSIQIDEQAFRVVGVAGRGFRDVHRRTVGTDVWMPLPARALIGRSPPDLARFGDPRGETLRLLAGRLTAGATRALAAAELSLLSEQFRSAASLPSSGIDVFDTRPLSVAPEGMQIVLPTYAPLLLSVLLVLLIACANVGNLLLSRALCRQREFAIRLSLGASRAQVVRQPLLEAAVLSTVAAALGIWLAYVMPHAMVGLGFGFGSGGFGRISLDSEALRPSFYAPDALVFWVAVLLAASTVVLAGLAPALRVARVGFASISAERRGRSTAGAPVRFVFLVAQIALTTLLLVGANLLTRAITHATSLSPGFTIGGIETVLVEPKTPAGPEMVHWKMFHLGLYETLNETDLGPVAFSQEPPLSDVPSVMMVRRPDDPPGPPRPILLRPVSRNYFAILSIPIVQGRVPASNTSSHELVVSEATVRTLWPGADPIGKTLHSAVSRTEYDTYEVVGVAKDVPVRSMSEIEPVIYRAPFWHKGTLVLRTSPGVVEGVRAIAAGLEPNVTVTGRPMADFVRDSLATAVLASRGAWAIGSLGLLLAMVGTFGVFGYMVEQRRYEIGVRLALGARAKQVAALVFRTASKALVWGLVVGFVLSLSAVSILRHFLYGLNPFDPAAYAQVAGILAVAAGLATWIPARRATAFDPADTLRSE